MQILATSHNMFAQRRSGAWQDAVQSQRIWMKGEGRMANLISKCLHLAVAAFLTAAAVNEANIGAGASARVHAQ